MRIDCPDGTNAVSISVWDWVGAEDGNVKIIDLTYNTCGQAVRGAALEIINRKERQ